MAFWDLENILQGIFTKTSVETLWCRLSWSIALMKNVNVIGINEATKEKKRCSVLKQMEEKLHLFKSSRACLCLTFPKKTKKTHYFLHSTSHFDNTSGIWIPTQQNFYPRLLSWSRNEQLNPFITITDKRTQCGRPNIQDPHRQYLSLFLCLSVSLLFPSQREQLTSFLSWHAISIISHRTNTHAKPTHI